MLSRSHREVRAAPIAGAPQAIVDAVPHPSPALSPFPSKLKTSPPSYTDVNRVLLYNSTNSYIYVQFDGTNGIASADTRADSINVPGWIDWVDRGRSHRATTRNVRSWRPPCRQVASMPIVYVSKCLVTSQALACLFAESSAVIPVSVCNSVQNLTIHS